MLLNIVAIGGTLAISVISLPAGSLFARLAKRFLDSAPTRYQKKQQQVVERMLFRLRRKRFLTIKSTDDAYELHLTEQGKHRLKLIALDHLTIEEPEEWDGLWRIVGFDVAETHRQARDSLRDLLKQLGFYRLQKSVWVLPWPCRDELEAIRAAHRLGDELWYAEAKVIDQEGKLRQWFELLDI